MKQTMKECPEIFEMESAAILDMQACTTGVGVKAACAYLKQLCRLLLQNWGWEVLDDFNIE